ncbi:class C sortase [Streptococcus parasuis]|uniref:class C sortase n=1 Tax=Streptococcus parasuis TaxID=1501662 RepID=UPI0023795366|nr:class C sortase [Streptococcus parasuis]WDN58175.1 class C sortase [Streptococcus parasuis]WDN59991.1 class C sortase [Streptococcus parasuis]
MARTRKNIKRKLIDTIMVLILVSGIGVLSYPFIRNSLNDLINQQLIRHYQEEANQKSKEEYQQQLSKMEEMNKQFAYQNISPGFDPFSDEAKEIEETKVIYEDHIIGVISIPKISVRLPIFDQTTEAFLSKGATYLEGTSYPIGGESTHSVISGHRGLTEAKLFTDLPDLVKGDRFYIELGEGEIHAYQVDDIKVVEPTDVSSLQIVKGQDYITLVTCTPYMVNSHRLLVRGYRIPYVPEQMESDEKEAKVDYYALMPILVASIALFLILLLLFGKYRRNRKHSPKR